MKLRTILCACLLIGSCTIASAQEQGKSLLPLLLEENLEEEDDEQDPELLERLRNMPNIEVGKGITFEPQNKLYSMTMRFRMQNLASFDFDEDFKLQETNARVKRLRLRFDGYIFSPKLLYSIQLGFTSYDNQTLANGNTNIVRDAMIYYMPNSSWSIGFGQTKIKANRARLNSSSALQFVDRSIVNSEFNIDRDFGVFGEYYKHVAGNFNMAAKASITLGEGRNWAKTSQGGFAYTGRIELYPTGRFGSKGEVLEGDFEREKTVKILIAGAYSYNDRTTRTGGQSGSVMPDSETRNLHSYFVDFILKYQGFAFYTDFMGRACDEPLFDGDEDAYVYTGNGVNVQTSYIFPSNWEIAVRNSTMLPKEEVRDLVGYKTYNQTTLAVTKYLIGHNLKLQADASYNHKAEATDGYNRWQLRFQIELGL